MMKMLVAVLLVVAACEHDPRYERHADQRSPAVAPVDAAGPAKTVERRVVDIPPMAHPTIAPIAKRVRHRRH